jgi:hypothetical protein
VKVYPDSHSEEFIEIVVGNLFIFPKCMSCTSDITKVIDKFEDKGLLNQI